MPGSVLTTKLYSPPPRPNLVSRSRLIQRLNDGLLQGRQFTLVSAPAGFGKTTLVSEWIGSLNTSTSWLSLDRGDNDALHVLHYLVAALQQVDGTAGQSVQQAMLSKQVPAVSVLIGMLINEISESGKKIVLVIDDYHTISAVEVHQLFQLWIERQPRNMHTVIITREDPPMPLPRMRARGQVTEIRERDLRFSETEVDSFYHFTMPLNLAPDEVYTLAARTEGWIAGLQMAGIALQEITDEDGVRSFIANFAGSDRYIVDYLVSEVLQSLPQPISDFLMQTSILERLCASLCDAVIMDGDGNAPSQVVLDELERMNLFITPLDNQRRWYRYHHLFSDLLRQRMALRDEHLVRTLHQRAAEWYGRNGLIDEGITHALAAGNSSFAADLVNRNWRQAQHEGRPKTAIKWISMLPAEMVSSSALLSAAYAWILFLMGKTEGLDQHIGNTNRALAKMAAEGTIPQDDFEYSSLPGQMGALQALLALRRGDIAGVQMHAKEAIRVAPQEDVLSRGLAWSALASSNRELGRFDDTIPSYIEAIRCSRTSGNLIAANISTRHLGRIYQVQGRLEDAEKLYQATIEKAEQAGNLHIPAFGIIYVMQADLAYERNHLNPARALLDKGLSQGRKGGYLELLMAAGILEARLRRVSGDIPGAIKALEETYQEVLQTEDQATQAEVAAWLAQFQAEAGNSTHAAHWADGLNLRTDNGIGLVQGIQLLRKARVLLYLGRLQEARDLSAWLAESSRETNSVGRLIESQMVEAECAWAQSEQERAVNLLQQAVDLAEPCGHTRTFVDEGSRLWPVLSACYKTTGRDTRQRAGIERLLAQFPNDVQGNESRTRFPAAPSRAPVLVDPLSDREVEVLRLLAEGLTQAEVAERLYLSPNTLKAHTQNIYSKLDAHSRVQAVNRARELGYL